MKLAKLSLAAIVVAGLASSSFAADTLADAFKNGKVNGELKAYYFANENASNERDSIFSTGIMLGYKTAPLYGFTLGLTAQGSASPFADAGGKADYAGDMWGSGAVLSEAYVAYNIGKTTAMVGRMFLDTPLVSGSGSRIIKEAFEGAAIINTDLPNTTLIAGYVQKFQSRTDGAGNVDEFSRKGVSTNTASVDINDGAYTAAVINKSIPGLTLTGAYAYAEANDVIDVNIVYVEALYEGKIGEIGYVLGAQDYYNNIDNAGTRDDSINLYAFKAGLSFKGLNGTIAYSQVSDDVTLANTIISGIGNGADLLYTDPVIGMPGYNRDTTSYLVDVNYDITASANVGARYVLAELADHDEDYTAVYGSYKFEGALKGFSLGAQYETKGKDVDGQDLWVKANYKF